MVLSVVLLHMSYFLKSTPVDFLHLAHSTESAEIFAQTSLVDQYWIVLAGSGW